MPSSKDLTGLAALLATLGAGMSSGACTSGGSTTGSSSGAGAAGSSSGSSSSVTGGCSSVTSSSSSGTGGGLFVEINGTNHPPLTGGCLGFAAGAAPSAPPLLNPGPAINLKMGEANASAFTACEGPCGGGWSIDIGLPVCGAWPTSDAGSQMLPTWVSVANGSDGGWSGSGTVTLPADTCGACDTVVEGSYSASVAPFGSLADAGAPPFSLSGAFRVVVICVSGGA